MSDGTLTDDGPLAPGLHPRPFPLAHLQASRQDKQLQTTMRDRVEEATKTSGAACPDCGGTGLELAWFYFRSPQWTWEALCGRAGVIAYCAEHQRQVAFEMDLMN